MNDKWFEILLTFIFFVHLYMRKREKLGYDFKCWNLTFLPIFIGVTFMGSLKYLSYDIIYSNFFLSSFIS